VSGGAKGAHVSRTVLRVRYAETDQMRIAYHANYLAWFEVGRCEWLRDQGWSYRSLESQDGVMLPVIEAHCEYRMPARYDDELEIRAQGTLLSPVRIRFDYEVTRLVDAARLAAGHTVHAATDMEGRPKRLPPRVRRLFGEAQSGSAM
jgi:acyl-CoA thioester hydrolase